MSNDTVSSKSAAVVAERFSEVVRQLGITQAELAKKAGISKVTVSNYARGHRTPAIDVLIAIDELGGDIRYILTGKVSNQHAASPSIDPHRFSLAIDEAKRQVAVNNEELEEREMIARAWVIYQAWLSIEPPVPGSMK